MKNFENTLQNENLPEKSFEEKKREFFIKLGLSVREALKMHKKADLWGEGKEDWRRVSKHCLAETARAVVFSDLLKFPEDLKKDLITATVLHDFYKKQEIAKADEKGLNWQSMEQADKEAEDLLRKNGFSDRIIKLVGSVGSVSLLETGRTLSKDQLSQEDIACLIVHYLDDISIESNWVEPAEVIEGRGKINILDKRMDRSDVNPEYAPINEAGIKIFGGKRTFQQQRDIGHMVEERLTAILGKSGETQIDDPKDLPYLIDEKIKEKISTGNY